MSCEKGLDLNYINMIGLVANSLIEAILCFLSFRRIYKNPIETHVDVQIVTGQGTDGNN